jgi:Phospholipase_D-nuclease N-terminal
LKLRSFYRFAFACSLASLVLACAFGILTFAITKNSDMPFGIAFPIVLLMALCALSGLSFWIGMIWDCLFQSRLSIHVKILWLIFMIMPIPYIGMITYYLVVFEKRPTQASEHSPMVQR